jgi:hypothetical protein
MMATVASPYLIDPALAGTTFGAALEAAEKARQSRRLREEQARADWLAAHPECRYATPVYPSAPQISPALYRGNPRQEESWAQTLARLEDDRWHVLKGNIKAIRQALVAREFVEWRLTGRGYTSFRITKFGREWLNDYRTLYLQETL